MDQNNLGQHDSIKIKADTKVPTRETYIREHLSKCNHCDFSSLWKTKLRKHLKTHSGEK